MRNPKPSKKKQLHKYARFSGIAFQMIVIIVLGAYAGQRLDKAYPNKYQLFTISFSFVALGVSMYYVISQVNKTPK
ncbi:MAG: Uncharacterised protein [Flavobacterium sp. SCGC AAA160-P02]|nr:MAG: Uncharacterised protein [Flavobacterium sp. SCGC AAA160-P02]